MLKERPPMRRSESLMRLFVLKKEGETVKRIYQICDNGNGNGKRELLHVNQKDGSVELETLMVANTPTSAHGIGGSRAPYSSMPATCSTCG